MSSANIDDIEDEDVLHKMMNQTDNFDERKRIRARMREIRETRAAAFEKQKAAREQNREDAVAFKQRQAAEAKAKKMAEYEEKAKKGKQDVGIVEQNIRERQARAEEEKKKKLDQYKEMAVGQAASYHAFGDTIRKAEQAASDKLKELKLKDLDQEATERSTTVIGPDGRKITTATATSRNKDGSTVHQVTQMGGGTSYGSNQSAEDVAKQLASSFTNNANTSTSGIIKVKTESWNKNDGVTKRSEKTELWQGRGGGRGGAANMFKKMDAQNAPPGGLAKPNFMASPGRGGGAGRGGGLQRSPSAIKQMLLDWCKAKTAGYDNVNVANFSGSWNDGMAFCALIHHFFPDAFDFSKLDPKNRRYNFQLAFDTAEKQADISPLLEVDDMVRFKNPDWKCVFCYVQSLYRNLRAREDPITPPTPPQ